MDLSFKATALTYRGVTPENLAQARALYERAFELDGQNVLALLGLGAVDVAVGSLFMTADPASALAQGEETLGKVLALAPESAAAHYFMGIALCATNRVQRGIEELNRALTIDPNFAAASAFTGLAHVYAGRAGEAEAFVSRAMRLSPRDPLAYMWFEYAGEAKACLGEFEQALPWLRRSIDANRNFPWTYFVLASCLAHLGQLGGARSEVKTGLTFDANFSIARFRAIAESDHPVYLAQRERLAEGMRLAGVPEQ